MVVGAGPIRVGASPRLVGAVPIAVGTSLRLAGPIPNPCRCDGTRIDERNKIAPTNVRCEIAPTNFRKIAPTNVSEIALTAVRRIAPTNDREIAPTRIYVVLLPRRNSSVRMMASAISFFVFRR